MFYRTEKQYSSVSVRELRILLWNTLKKFFLFPETWNKYKGAQVEDVGSSQKQKKFCGLASEEQANSFTEEEVNIIISLPLSCNLVISLKPLSSYKIHSLELLVSVASCLFLGTVMQVERR